MFQISDNGAIRLTKGDSVTLDVTLTDDSGTAYAVSEGDAVTMHISNGTDEYEMAAESYSDNIAQIVLNTEFTATLDGVYLYDIVIMFSTGEQYTLISPASLTVTEGVE